MPTTTTCTFGDGAARVELDYNASTLLVTAVRGVNGSAQTLSLAAYREGGVQVGTTRTVPPGQTVTQTVTPAARRAVTVEADGGVNSPYELRMELG